MENITPAMLEQVAQKLAVHLADATLWEALPVAFKEVAGRLPDRGNAHDIMLCQHIIDLYHEKRGNPLFPVVNSVAVNSPRSHK